MPRKAFVQKIYFKLLREGTALIALTFVQLRAGDLGLMRISVISKICDGMPQYAGMLKLQAVCL